MKGPSLDAIRKFKQQQEQKKKDEEARRVQEKLSTLEHRASRGDKKAKVQLKKIEQVQETKPDVCKQSDDARGGRGFGHYKQSNGCKPSNGSHRGGTVKHKPNNAETDFEELMRLAKNNTNEIKKREEPKEKIRRVIPKFRTETAKPLPDKPKKAPINSEQTSKVDSFKPERPTPSTSNDLSYKPQQRFYTHQPIRSIPPPNFRSRLPARREYDDDYDDYDDEEDEYESDGFVVNEESDEAREELKKTLKNVFRYDRRRCDLREQELDRQYRQIGRVSTFEDLEREERRAGRLAAAEDAEEQRNEEERKRLKKMRLKGLRD